MGNKKIQVWLPLIFSLLMIAGMFIGYKLNDNPGSKKGFFSTGSRNSLQEALDLIKLRYVDLVAIDSLQGKAIREVMAELDPHSVYLSPEEVKEADEDLEGKFEGIGVEFNVFNDTVNAVYVIPDAPGDKAGLKIGDKLLEVNGNSLTRKGQSNDSIKALIKGPKGTKAAFKIMRDGQQQSVTVSRGTIPVLSVDASYMIDDKTGYIKLNKFSSTTYEEFMDAMETLKKQNLQSLILDLRDNGGGLMEEATDIADEFLDGEKLIVYTQGENSKKREYRCKRPGIFENGKLIVLIDELSASASEVLAGALQDWCRAKIIGRRSFGKGLVQDQFSLTDGSGIRLTIARYYTPLGRSIQRSYEKGKKIYLDDFMERYHNGELLYADSNKITNGKAFVTNCKDTVYGGGGIMPDVFVPIDTIFYTQLINDIFNGSAYNSFIYHYYLDNRQQLDQYKTITDFIANVDAAKVWQAFTGYAGTATYIQSIKLQEKDKIQQRMKAMLARYRWRNQGFYQVMNNYDHLLEMALQQIKK
ncbi:MAG: S41 family peptidase [Sphingobacteriales bacterium]|nr:S41 family peptidase [Sphingobacteriales bacterium]